MIAVIFELQAADGQRDTYLALAAELKPLLAQIDGFISIERFQSWPILRACCRSPSGATRRRCSSGAISSSTGRRRRAAVARCWRSIGCGWRKWCGTTGWRDANRRRRIAVVITALEESPPAAGFLRRYFASLPTFIAPA